MAVTLMILFAVAVATWGNDFGTVLFMHMTLTLDFCCLELNCVDAAFSRHAVSNPLITLCMPKGKTL